MAAKKQPKSNVVPVGQRKSKKQLEPEITEEQREAEVIASELSDAGVNVGAYGESEALLGQLVTELVDPIADPLREGIEAHVASLKDGEHVNPFFKTLEEAVKAETDELMRTVNHPPVIKEVAPVLYKPVSSDSEAKQGEALTVASLEPVEIPQNELLVFRDDGSLEPATQEDLVKIGSQMLRELFAKPEVTEALTVAQVEKPPAPKLQTNHCRLCNWFVSDDSRGPLWAKGGKCSAQWPQASVEPEFYCNRFIFNEGLRDNN